MSRTIAISGGSSGIGGALCTLLRSRGDHVINIDIRAGDADENVIADLSTVDGRNDAVGEIFGLTDRLDALVTCAGLAGLSDRPGDILASVNYFGTVALLDGLRALLCDGGAALAFSSNSTTTQPGVPMHLVDALLEGDEDKARSIANEVSSVMTYPATKTAVARWVRRNAVQHHWVGNGIRLNALAPGSVNTAMTDGVRADAVFGQFIDMFPVPTGAATPEEIAEIAAFLISPAARFFCGSVVFADGGSDALLRPDDWPVPAPLPTQ